MLKNLYTIFISIAFIFVSVFIVYLYSDYSIPILDSIVKKPSLSIEKLPLETKIVKTSTDIVDNAMDTIDEIEELEESFLDNSSRSIKELEEQKKEINNKIADFEKELGQVEISLAVLKKDCKLIEKEDERKKCEEEIVLQDKKEELDEAISKQDKELCEKIKDKKDREECIQTIENILLNIEISAALAKNNIKFCKELDTDIVQVCEDAYNNKKDQQGYSSIIQKRDLKKCKTLILEVNKKACVKNINQLNDTEFYGEAVSKKDQNYCSKIANIETKNLCIKQLEAE